MTHGSLLTVRFAGFVVATLLLVVVAAGPLRAHTDEAARIEEINQQLASQPDQPGLYLERSELHLALGQCETAWSDINQAERYRPNLRRLTFIRGRILYDCGRVDKALDYLNRYLARASHDAQARLVRARVLASDQQYAASVEDYTNALEILPHPSPRTYLERAEVQLDRGPEHVDEALRGLDKGNERLGNLVSLQERAIEIAFEAELYKETLHRIDRVLKTKVARAPWLERRGRVLAASDRFRKAVEAYRKALSAVRSLPTPRRETAAYRKLERTLARQIQSLRKRPEVK